MFIDLNIHSFECSEFNFELELVEIRHVYTCEELSEFAKINAMSWDPIDVNVLDFYEQNQELFLEENCPLRFYLGFADGIPIVTCEASYDKDTVGFYNICTRQERGYASHILKCAL
ncbi:acetyltransferase [Leptospira interrogans]|uniref:acetyltransferase n=1 Tax=Leptospira interrogans TaxID=173 RepID=UPI00158364C1|nr:acetyltransferase [Leptospira interrogans]